MTTMCFITFYSKIGENDCIQFVDDSQRTYLSRWINLKIYSREITIVIVMNKLFLHQI